MFDQTGTPESGIDDDPNVTWSGVTPYVYSGNYGYPGGNTPDPSSAELSADLAAVIANTQGDGTPLVEPPPITNTPIALASDATLTVDDPNQTVDASGAGSTINFGNIGETASISDGFVNLASGAGAAITGDDNLVTLSSGDTASVNGTSSTIQLEAGDTLSLSGLYNTVNVTGTYATIVDTGGGNTVNVEATGLSALLGGGIVTFVDGIAGSVSGQFDTVYLGSEDVL